MVPFAVRISKSTANVVGTAWSYFRWPSDLPAKRVKLGNPTRRARMNTLISGAKRWLMLLAGVLLLTACGGDADKNQAPSYRSVEGATMGTYYRVQYRESENVQPANKGWMNYCRVSIKACRPMLPTLRSVRLTARMRRSGKRYRRAFFCAASGLAVWRESEGAFDVTIGPLVNLWGFGPLRSSNYPP